MKLAIKNDDPWILNYALYGKICKDLATNDLTNVSGEKPHVQHRIDSLTVLVVHEELEYKQLFFSSSQFPFIYLYMDEVRPKNLRDDFYN